MDGVSRLGNIRYVLKWMRFPQQYELSIKNLIRCFDTLETIRKQEAKLRETEEIFIPKISIE